MDALLVTTPDHWHAPMAILAAKAGKHVYVEKPCSHNPREGEILVEVARKHERLVQMGSQRRSIAQRPADGAGDPRGRDRQGVSRPVLLLPSPPADRLRQGHRAAGGAGLGSVAGAGPAHGVPRQPPSLQLALVLALGHGRGAQQRRASARRGALGDAACPSRPRSTPSAVAGTTWASTTGRRRTRRRSSSSSAPAAASRGSAAPAAPTAPRATRPTASSSTAARARSTTTAAAPTPSTTSTTSRSRPSAGPRPGRSTWPTAPTRASTTRTRSTSSSRSAATRSSPPRSTRATAAPCWPSSATSPSAPAAASRPIRRTATSSAIPRPSKLWTREYAPGWEPTV